MTDRIGTRPVPAGMVGQLVRGFYYPLEALGFLRQYKLWGLAGVSIGINIVLLIGLIVGTLVYARPWLHELNAWLSSTSSLEAIRLFWSILSWLVTVVFVLLAIAANALILLLVGQAVASPFLDMLSEKVEGVVLHTEEYPFSVGRTIRSVLVAVSDLVWSIVFLVVVNVPIWLIGFIPVIGTAASGVLSTSFTALLLALEFMGMPLTRHLVSYPRRWRQIWANKWMGLGFGLAAMVVLLVPGLNLVLLPLAAVGGTLAYCDLKAAGRITEPRGGASIAAAV